MKINCSKQQERRLPLFRQHSAILTSPQIRIMKAKFVRKAIVPTPVWDSLQSVFFDENIPDCEQGGTLNRRNAHQSKPTQLSKASTTSKREIKSSLNAREQRIGEPRGGSGSNGTLGGPRKSQAPHSSVLMKLDQNADDPLPAPRVRVPLSRNKQSHSKVVLSRRTTNGGRSLFDDLEQGGIVITEATSRKAGNRSMGRRTRRSSEVNERKLNEDLALSSALAAASCGAAQERLTTTEDFKRSDCVRSGGGLHALFSPQNPSIPRHTKDDQLLAETTLELKQQAPSARRKVKPKRQRAPRCNDGAVDEPLMRRRSPRLLANSEEVDGVACRAATDTTVNPEKPPPLQASHKRRQTPPFASPIATAGKAKRKDVRLTPIRVFETEASPPALTAEPIAGINCHVADKSETLPDASDLEVRSRSIHLPDDQNSDIDDDNSRCHGGEASSRLSGDDHASSDDIDAVACDHVSLKSQQSKGATTLTIVPADSPGSQPASFPAYEGEMDAIKAKGNTSIQDNHRECSQCEAEVCPDLPQLATNPKTASFAQEQSRENDQNLESPTDAAEAHQVAESNGSDRDSRKRMSCHSIAPQPTQTEENVAPDYRAQSRSKELRNSAEVPRESVPTPCQRPRSPSTEASNRLKSTARSGHPGVIDDTISDVTMSVVTDGQMGCENELEIPCFVSIPLQWETSRPKDVENADEQGLEPNPLLGQLSSDTRDRAAEGERAKVASGDDTAKPESVSQRLHRPVIANLKVSDCIASEEEKPLEERTVEACGPRMQVVATTDERDTSGRIVSDQKADSSGENGALTSMTRRRGRPKKQRDQTDVEAQKRETKIPFKKNRNIKMDPLSVRRSTRPRAVPTRLGVVVFKSPEVMDRAPEKRDRELRCEDHRPSGAKCLSLGRESLRKAKSSRWNMVSNKSKQAVEVRGNLKANKMHNGCAVTALSPAEANGRPQRARHQPERFGSYADLSDQDREDADTVHSDRDGSRQQSREPQHPDSSSTTASLSKVAKLRVQSRLEPQLSNNYGRSDSNNWATLNDLASSWSNQQISQLREAYDHVDPTSMSFWMDVALLAKNGKSALECRDKWFSLVKTPQPHRGKEARKLHMKGVRGALKDVEDDIFNSTPMRAEETEHVRLPSNLKVAIPSEGCRDDEVENQVIDYYSNQQGAKPGFKTYIQAMRRDILRSKKERKKKVGNPVVKTKAFISESTRNGDIDMNIRLSPGGTLRIKNLNEEVDDFWDEFYEGEDEN